MYIYIFPAHYKLNTGACDITGFEYAIQCFLCVIALLMKIIWYENHFTIVAQNYYSWLALHNSLYFDKLTIYVFS